MKNLLKIDLLKKILEKNTKLSNSDEELGQLTKTGINKNITHKLYPDTDLVNAIDTPFIVLDISNKILFLNNASKEIFGIQKNDNVFYIFRRPEFRENINKFKKIKSKKHQFTIELFEIPQTKFYNVKLFQLPDKNILLSFIDITRLQKLEDLRTDFIGNVSHELKTPLSTMMNILEILTNEDNSEKEKKKLLKFLDIETNKMKFIIEDLLKLTKIETDFNKKIRTIVDLNQVIKDSIFREQTNAKKNKIKIRYKPNKYKNNILGDKNQLHQLCINIIDNAIKYSGKNSIIDINLKNTKNLITLIVADKGKGIPSSCIPRVTERFYRVSDNKLKNIEGTGLGLAIVKHITLRHKASLNITSQLGKGTIIKINFKKNSNNSRFDL